MALEVTNRAFFRGRRRRPSTMKQAIFSTLIVAMCHLCTAPPSFTCSAFVSQRSLSQPFRDAKTQYSTPLTSSTREGRPSKRWRIFDTNFHRHRHKKAENQRRFFPSFNSRKRVRQVGEIRMREAEELGGVPRSDRYSSSDWLHNTLSLPSSAILRSIRGPVFFMTAWAGLLSFAHRRFLITSPAIADYMCIPLAPHSLMVSALSLLLVFKTNSAYQRFAEGRKIWENIINNARDLYRMMNLYENEMGRSKRRRLQRLLAAFPYLLRHRIRPNLVMYRLDDVENVRDPEHSIVLYQDKAANDLDPEAAKVATQEENEGMSRRKPRPLYWVDKRTLPWRLLPPDALEPCARAQNRPLWVCDRMALELKNIPDGPHFSARERLALITKVERLSQCIGACERIHQTVVPLNYARHSLRALTLFLFTLPFCLVEPLKLLTAPALFLISWLMFGIYEIGYSIEDPFQGTLRLSVLCDAIRRDVLADEVIRSTAFVSTNVEEMKSEATISIIDAENIQDDDGDYEDYENSSIVKEKKRTKTDTKIQFEGFSETPVVSEDYLRKKP